MCFRCFDKSTKKNHEGAKPQRVEIRFLHCRGDSVLLFASSRGARIFLIQVSQQKTSGKKIWGKKMGGRMMVWENASHLNQRVCPARRVFIFLPWIFLPCSFLAAAEARGA
jgi:hypothetical protein